MYLVYFAVAAAGLEIFRLFHFYPRGQRGQTDMACCKRLVTGNDNKEQNLGGQPCKPAAGNL